MFTPDPTAASNELPQARYIEASLDILGASEPRSACMKLTSWIRSLLPVENVRVWLTGPERKQIQVALENGSLLYSANDPAEVLDHGLVGQVMKSGQPVLSGGEGGQPGSEMAIPILSNGKAIGAVLLTGGPGIAYSQAEMALVSSLAAQAAAAIETGRLYKAELERLKSEAALIQAGRKLSGNIKPTELPTRILGELSIVVPYERGSLLLKEGDFLSIAAQRGFPEDERTRRLMIELRPGDVYFKISNASRPVLIDDVSTDPSWKQVEWLPLNLSWLGLPLFSKDCVVGMVSLTRKERNAFSQEDVLLASAFALQASVALDNATLYEEITRFNQQLEKMVQQRTEELKQALDALERMDKKKSDFIGVAAHELRTPLTVMKGYLGMLQGDALVKVNPNLLLALDGVLKGADRLQDVVNSMLDVIRIDNEVLDLQTEMVSISAILKRVRADDQVYLEDRRQTLLMENLEMLPLIRGDSTALLKVFQAVVINAIKYTPDGGKISIFGQQELDPVLGACVEVQVQDNGIGIDPDQRELIFEKLYSTGNVSLHSSGKASYKGGGPGLGLAIARGIVLAHHGRIWVESERQDEVNFPGSCFHILLPINSVQAPE